MIITIYYKMLRATVGLMGKMIFKEQKQLWEKSQTVAVSIKPIKLKGVPWVIVQIDSTWAVIMCAICGSIKM